MAGIVSPPVNGVAIRIDPPMTDQGSKAIVQVKLNGGTVTLAPRVILAGSGAVLAADGQLVEWNKPGASGTLSTADINASGIYEFPLNGKSLILTPSAVTGAPVIVFNVIEAAASSGGGGSAAVAATAVISRFSAPTFTRSAVLTAYASGQTLANSVGESLQQIVGFGAANTDYQICGVKVTTNNKLTLGSLRRHFFSSNALAAGSHPADYAVFPLVLADEGFHNGGLDLPSFNTEDTSSTFAFCYDSLVRWNVRTDANGDLWFVDEWKSAQTPIAAQTFKSTIWRF